MQFYKNTALHRGIQEMPYKAMFGSKPQIGLESSILPPEIYEKLETEEDLENCLLKTFGEESEQEDETGLCETEQSNEPFKCAKMRIFVTPKTH